MTINTKWMTVKNLFLSICFLGGVVLVTFGAWNYIWGRINFGNETMKAERLKAKGYTEYDSKELLQKIKKEKTNALIMFAAGTLLIYFVIAQISRSRNALKTYQIKNSTT